MSDRGFATGPDPLSSGFVDNRDKRISALEAENAALKAELTDTKRKTATLRETNRALMDRAHRRKAQVNKMQRERDALRGDVRKSDYVVALDFRIVALKQENAALKAERDAARAWASIWKRAAKGHRQNAERLDCEAESINEMRNEARAWAAAWRRKAMKSYAMYVHMHAIYHRSNGSVNIFGVPYESVVDNALKLFSRAISGTAQRARSQRRMEEVSRRYRRAAEAAEVQERR